MCDAMDEETSFSALQLEEERLKLEREALAVERERLAAQRLHAEAERKLSDAKKHPAMAFAVVALLVALSFAGGMIVGGVRAEERMQNQRERRIKEALAQLDNHLSDTNRPAARKSGTESGGGGATSAHRDVAVVVIQ